jgi:hypothetical protein
MIFMLKHKNFCHLLCCYTHAQSEDLPIMKQISKTKDDSGSSIGVKTLGEVQAGETTRDHEYRQQKVSMEMLALQYFYPILCHFKEGDYAVE